MKQKGTSERNIAKGDLAGFGGLVDMSKDGAEGWVKRGESTLFLNLFDQEKHRNKEVTRIARLEEEMNSVWGLSGGSGNPLPAAGTVRL